MKALSIRQPWAELIASGRKTIETRTWTTRYRGAILICAGQSYMVKGCFDHLGRNPLDSELGVAVAIAELYGVATMAAEHEAAAMVKASPSLFAWYLRGIQRIKPFPVKGKLGLFDAPIPAEMNGDISRMP